MTVNLHDNYTLFQVKTFEMLITRELFISQYLMNFAAAESSPLLEMKKSLF